jgi:hypothetical protein
MGKSTINGPFSIASQASPKHHRDEAEMDQTRSILEIQQEEKIPMGNPLVSKNEAVVKRGKTFENSDL